MGGRAIMLRSLNQTDSMFVKVICEVDDAAP
jgi:hypothetical protein